MLQLMDRGSKKKNFYTGFMLFNNTNLLMLLNYTKISLLIATARYQRFLWCFRQTNQANLVETLDGENKRFSIWNIEDICFRLNKDV